MCVNVQGYWCASNLFNNSFSSSGYTALINNELWNMRKEAVVILFGVLSYNMRGGLGENHSIPSSELLISKLKFSSRTSWVKIKSSDIWIGIFGHMAVLATTMMMTMTTTKTTTTTNKQISTLCALLLICVHCCYCIGVFLDSVLKMCAQVRVCA